MDHAIEMITGPRDGYSRADLAMVVREGVHALRRVLGILEEMDA
jgi:hypothetical protein